MTVSDNNGDAPIVPVGLRGKGRTDSVPGETG